MMITNSALLYISVFIFAFITSSTFADSEVDIENESSFDEEDLSRIPTEEDINKDKDLSSTPTEEDINKDNEVPKYELYGSVNKTASSTNKTYVISCILNRPNPNLTVEIVNATRLATVLQVEYNITHRGVPGTCAAVIFYSPSCPFSALAAPYFNALPRFFPDIKMVAVNAMYYRSFNTQYGVVGTPTLMLFHSGRPAFKFNDTSNYGLETFAKFITKHTEIKPVGKLEVTPEDHEGPLSSVPVEETDYYLTLSWLVIAARILYWLVYSRWGKSLADATLKTWREAEEQHEHQD